MDLEKEITNLQWYKKNDLRIRVKTENNNSIVWVMLKEYNICSNLVMYDFVDRVKDELLFDITINKIWHGQVSFLINSDFSEEFICYISEFIEEWDIKVTEKTVSKSNIISNELWYSL